MSQISFADAEYGGKRKKTRREVFLEEMELVVPWQVLLKIIEPHYPVAGCGRRPYALESMLRVHLMQNWFALSDPAMEEACTEMASLRSFARLSLNEPIPDEMVACGSALFRASLGTSQPAESCCVIARDLMFAVGRPSLLQEAFARSVSKTFEIPVKWRDLRRSWHVSATPRHL